MFKYALKRVVRSYKLFVALTLGVMVATSFFASTNVAADILARDALDASLEGVAYDFTVNSIVSNWTMDTIDAVENELETVPEVTDYTRTSSLEWDFNETDIPYDMFGIQWDSYLADGVRIVSGRPSLGPNETYVVAGSRNESLLVVDDVITVPITILRSDTPIPQTIEWNFTIAGFVELNSETKTALTQENLAGILLGAFGLNFESPFNMMIYDWQETTEPIINHIAGIENRTGTQLTNSIHLNINRMALIDPYDIGASTNRISEVQSRIAVRLDRFDVLISSNLMIPLFVYQITALMMNITFISLSLPIFFMAYFTGTMVSDVSYNLRRREIGLLLTKGYKRGTIRNMFLVEGAIVGAIAGGVSVFIGSAVSWAVVGTQGVSYLSVLENNITSIVLSIILGMFLALFSVYRPANRAAKLEIIDALKQYVYVEEQKEYKKLLPTISFVLGTYKLIVWILGVEMNVLLGSITTGNFLLSILIVAWLAIDGILNFFGPLMFLYGTTKIFMRGSLRFQEAVVNAGSRFFGAFGKLATRNVKRNPTRNAAMVFIVALIVSYGVFTVGSLYSEYDRVDRIAAFDVGSDLRLEMQIGTNVENTIGNVTEFDSVESVTPEYRLDLRAGTTSIEARAIRPDEWMSTAFYEAEWFIGDVNQVIADLADNGIILSVTIADTLGLQIGDSFFVRGSIMGDPFELTVVGLIGYISFLDAISFGMGGGPGGPGDFAFSAAGNYPSFVSESFLNNSDLLDAATPNILIKTNADVNGTALQEEMIDTVEGVESSYSITSEIADYWARPIASGVTKIQWVAISFAIVLALVGTGLVIVLTIKEKEAEIALITVRGFSKWQLFKTLMAEMTVMVMFSLILGTFVGFVQNFGNISQLNGNLTQLIRYRFIVGGMAGWTMLLIIGVVMLAAALPVWWAARRPEAKVEVLRA
ncbi:MAG: ABC transporter permease [Candidatus Thorarchaeota archaeon]|jgi:ABC-type lipoprotein release transport system permease subunit